MLVEFSTALVLGIAGSAHCAGMCGPLVIATSQVRATVARPGLDRLAYQAGRLSTYALMGLVAGAIGLGAGWAGIQRGLSIVIGVLLLATLAAGGLRWGWLIRRVERLKSGMGLLLARPGHRSMVAFGLLNGLLPCGLVYVALAGALALGDPVSGAGYMLVFGGGTLPVLLALSFAGVRIPVAWRLRLQGWTPVWVGLMGAALVLRGLGLGVPYLSPAYGADGVARPCCEHHVPSPPTR